MSQMIPMLPVAAVGLISALVAPPVSVVPTCAVDGGLASGTASFAIVDSAGSRTLSFSSEVNLVFCRQTSETMTWIRIAESRENDGGDGPHLDIDVCFMSQGGHFSPMDARAQPCPGGKTWGVWWHESATRVFATHATSTPCELQIEVETTRLTGTFSCRGLTNDGGTETIDLLDGHFEFVVETVRSARAASREVRARNAEALR